MVTYRHIKNYNYKNIQNNRGVETYMPSEPWHLSPPKILVLYGDYLLISYLFY